MLLKVLELKAVYLTLLTFPKIYKSKSFHTKIKNTIFLTYLVKIGGNTGQIEIVVLENLAKQIWSFLLSEYLSGSLNMKVDYISRYFQAKIK